MVINDERWMKTETVTYVDDLERRPEAEDENALIPESYQLSIQPATGNRFWSGKLVIRAKNVTGEDIPGGKEDCACA